MSEAKPALSANKRNLILAVAGVVIVVGIGIGYLMSRTSAPEPAAMVQTATEPPKEEPPDKTHARDKPPRVAASNHSPDHPKAAAPKATPKATTKPPATAAATVPAVEPKKTASSPKPEKKPVAPEEPKPAVIESPEKECEGKNFFMFQICMKEQCNNSKYAQHPVCVERRAMEQRNRGSL